MNQSKIVLTATACSVFTLFVGGCGSEEEKKAPVAVVQERPKAPPKPKAKSIEKLVSSMSIDPRIYIEEKEAPRSEQQRIAILTFFDAMLRVDATALKSMLSAKDQLALDTMVDDGLSSFVDDVSLVMLQTGNSPDGRTCVMAIYEIDLDYQVQLWYLDETGNSITFVAVETPPRLVNKLSGNWIENYFEWKKKQAEIALQPDEETSYALAEELTSSDGSVGTDESRPGGPSGPSGPGGPSGPRGPNRPGGSID